MFLPRPGLIPAGTRQIPESWFRRLDAYLRAITLRNSGTTRVQIGPGGSTVETKDVRRGGGSGSSEPQPFEVLPASDEDGPKVKVYRWSRMMGIQNAAVEINWLDFAFDVEAGSIVWLKLSVTGETIDSADIIVSDVDAWTDGSDYPDDAFPLMHQLEEYTVEEGEETFTNVSVIAIRLLLAEIVAAASTEEPGAGIEIGETPCKILQRWTGEIMLFPCLVTGGVISLFPDKWGKS